jgi:hypothetical protein
MIHGVPVRFGLKPERPGRPMLCLDDYLGRAKTLPTPTYSDWTTKITVPWGMMGNSQYGDCAKADDAHFCMVLTAYGRGSLVQPTDAQAVAQYLQETGGHDDGLVPSDDLDYWVKNPLAGVGIDAWASVRAQNQSMALLVCQCFGGLKTIWNLPDNFTDAINQGVAWTDTSYPANPGNCHDMLLVKTEADGPTVVTWGQLQKMSWAWFMKYNTAAYLVLGTDWDDKTTAPSGILLQDLRDDFAALSGQTLPPLPSPPSPPAPPAPSIPSWVPVIVDDCFKEAEGLLAGNTAAVAVLEELQSYVDSLLGSSSQLARVACVRPELVHARVMVAELFTGGAWGDMFLAHREAITYGVLFAVSEAAKVCEIEFPGYAHLLELVTPILKGVIRNKLGSL